MRRNWFSTCIIFVLFFHDPLWEIKTCIHWNFILIWESLLEIQFDLVNPLNYMVDKNIYNDIKVILLPSAGCRDNSQGGEYCNNVIGYRGIRRTTDWSRRGRQGWWGLQNWLPKAWPRCLGLYPVSWSQGSEPPWQRLRSVEEELNEYEYELLLH